MGDEKQPGIKLFETKQEREFKSLWRRWIDRKISVEESETTRPKWLKLKENHEENEAKQRDNAVGENSERKPKFISVFNVNADQGNHNLENIESKKNSTVQPNVSTFNDNALAPNNDRYTYPAPCPYPPKVVQVINIGTEFENMDTDLSPTVAEDIDSKSGVLEYPRPCPYPSKPSQNITQTDLLKSNATVPDSPFEDAPTGNLLDEDLQIFGEDIKEGIEFPNYLKDDKDVSEASYTYPRPCPYLDKPVKQPTPGELGATVEAPYVSQGDETTDQQDDPSIKETLEYPRPCPYLDKPPRKSTDLGTAADFDMQKCMIQANGKEEELFMYYQDEVTLDDDQVDEPLNNVPEPSKTSSLSEHNFGNFAGVNKPKWMELLESRLGQELSPNNTIATLNSTKDGLDTLKTDDTITKGFLKVKI